MIKTTLRSPLYAVLTALAAATASSTFAATLEMQVLDLELVYDSSSGGTGELFDDNGADSAGGNMDANEADDVQAVQIAVDGAPVLGSPFTNDMWGDLLLKEVQIQRGDTLTTVGNNGDSFGFHWFDDSGHFLKLNFDRLDVLLQDGVFFVTGIAKSLDSQNLPAGGGFDPSMPIVVSYTATLPSINGDDDVVDSVYASGAMTISGTQIPEPAAVGLTAVAVALAGLTVRRRRDR